MESENSCPVCYDPFEESGERMPRLLPCSHTACDACLVRMSTSKTTVCGECRKRHMLPKKTKQFPENRYILSAMRALREKDARNENASREKSKNFKMCTLPGHRRDLSLHCKSCKVYICVLCIIELHQSHEVVDIMKERIDKLTLKIDMIKWRGQLYLGNVAQTQGKRKRAVAENIELLRRQKEKIMTLFDDMIEKHEDHTATMEDDMDINSSSVNDHLGKLTSVLNSMQSSGRASIQDCETVERAEKKILETTLSYQFLHYNPLDEQELLKVCSSPEEHEEPLGLPEMWFPNKFLFDKQIICCSDVLSSGTIFLVKEDTSLTNSEKSYILMQYTIKCEVQLSHNLGQDRPLQMVRVKLRGNWCLALSYFFHKRIDFYDLKDLKQTTLSLSVAPHVPGTMSVANNTNLMLIDLSKNTHELKVLDLDSNSPVPRPVRKTGKKLQRVGIFGFCHVKDNGKDLLAVTLGAKTLSVYNLKSGDLVWSVEGELPDMKEMAPMGVLNNGRGQLCVSDRNNQCLQLFSIDGQYLGTMLNPEHFLSPTLMPSSSRSESSYPRVQWSMSFRIEVARSSTFMRNFMAQTRPAI